MNQPFSNLMLNSVNEHLVWQMTQIDGSHYRSLAELGLKLPLLPSRAVTKRRHEFYAGRWCAAEGLLCLLGERQVPDISDNRAPCWPGLACGSISHTRDWAIAAVGRRSIFRSVGIDIECLSALPADPEWQALLATQEELLLVREFGPLAGIGLIFSAKESVFKALNPLVGIFFDFKDARVVSVSDRSIDICLERNLGPDFKAGTHFRLNYVQSSRHILTCLAIKA